MPTKNRVHGKSEVVAHAQNPGVKRLLKEYVKDICVFYNQIVQILCASNRIRKYI